MLPGCLSQQFASFYSIGGANAVKEPGHFEVRKSLSQIRAVFDAAKSLPDLNDLTANEFWTF